jgi:putative membrane protein
MNRVVRLIANAAALWVAARFVDGINFKGNGIALLGVAVVFGVVNTFVKPILSILSLPIQILTLGLFTLVLNALMLMLTGWAAQQLGIAFSVSGFVPALLGAVIVSIVSIILNAMFSKED